MKNQLIMTLVVSTLFLILNINGFGQNGAPPKKPFFSLGNWSKKNDLLINVAKFSEGKFQTSVYVYNTTSKTLQVLLTEATEAVFSPDNKTIVFTRPVWTPDAMKRTSTICLYHFDSKKIDTLSSLAGRSNSPSFSLDGKTIVFSSGLPGRDVPVQLYSVRVDGTELTKLVDDGVKNFGPKWSPRENKIVYYKERGDHHDQIYLYDMSMKKEWKITNDTLHNIFPFWMPDGKTIVYTRMPSGKLAPAAQPAQQFIQIDLNGNMKIISAMDTRLVNASQRKKKVAYTDGEIQKGTQEVYISDADGSGAECITCGKFN